MPAYFDKATGKRVTVDEATFDGKRTRPGFYATIEDGESVRFSVNMLDNVRSSSSVFLTDQATDARVNLEVAMARASHDRKFAFMGDRAPPFNEGNARVAAAAKVNAAINAEMVDAARQANATGEQPLVTASKQRAYDKATAYKSARDVRDHARANRY